MRPVLFLFAATLALWVAAAEPMPMDRTIPLDAAGYLVTFVDGGKTLAALCEDGKLRLWDVQSGAARPAHPTLAGGRPASLVPGSDRIAMVSDNGTVRIWDTKTASLARELPAITPRANHVAISGGGSFIATTHMPDRQSGVNVVRLRDAAGKELFNAPAGLGGISILGFSPDGSTVVAGAWDADLRVWTVRNGELVKLIDTLPVAMFAMSFSPDGKWLATAGVDRTIYLWDTKRWKLEKKLTGQPEIISALAFSPDGRRLVTGGFDSAAMANSVKLIIWDVDTAKPLRTETVPHAVIGVAFSPDGKQIASLSVRDRSIRLWQAAE